MEAKRPRLEVGAGQEAASEWGNIVADLRASKTISPAESEALQTRALAMLKHSDSVLRKAALTCLALLAEHTLFPEGPLRLIAGRMNDPDQRVRACALQALFAAFSKGSVLPCELYAQAVAATNDDCFSVRVAALAVVWALSQQHAEFSLPANSLIERSHPLRDDAFAVLCDAAQDASAAVRAAAMGHLQRMPGVTLAVLLQTFDKKALPPGHKPVARMAPGRNRGPLGDQEVADVIAATGARGAFIHGFEDDDYMVRQEAVAAVHALAVPCRALAEAALDFVVDMLNDDIESIRLDAIRALGALSVYYVFAEEHIEVILGMLDDTTSAIRHATHRLLQGARLAGHNTLRAIVHRAVDSLRKYPADHRSVCRALRGLGEHHGDFAEFLIGPLLRGDFHFAQVEPSRDDPVYACLASLFLAAAHASPAVRALLPPYLRRHARYLHDCYPEEIALLPDDTVLALVTESETDTSVVCGLVTQLPTVWALPTRARVPRLAALVRAIAACGPAGAFALHHTQCLQLLADQREHFPAALATHLALMQHGFAAAPLLLLAEWRLVLRASTLTAVGAGTIARTRVGASVGQGAGALRDLRLLCDDVLRLGHSPTARALLAVLDTDPSLLQENPISVLQTLPAPTLPSGLIVRRREVTITAPTHDTLLTVLPGLPCSLVVAATAQHITDPSLLAAVLVYPNGTHSVTPARADSFTVVDESTLEVSIDVPVNTAVWADQASIEVGLGLRLPAIEHTDALTTLHSIYNTESGPVLRLGHTAVRCQTMTLAKIQTI
eukprot:m.101978 g.101978  ORF g.101978 m.101978 type:complete len:784 (+) comp14105_c0_seq2:60-2411(+)